jgi:hypothetical protein
MEQLLRDLKQSASISKLEGLQQLREALSSGHAAQFDKFVDLGGDAVLLSLMEQQSSSDSELDWSDTLDSVMELRLAFITRRFPSKPGPVVALVTSPVMYSFDGQTLVCRSVHAHMLMQ